MSAIKIIKGEATVVEIAAIKKALANRKLENIKSNRYGKMENNS
jgi:hypothetical protein